jgi:MFS family permease
MDPATSKTQRQNFILLFLGQLISQFGDSVFHIGLLWIAIQETGSNTIAGFIVALGYLPAIMFSLTAGVVVDRVDRRRLMISCALVQGLVVAVVPILFHFDLLSAVILAFVTFGLSTGAAFFNPARDALIPQVVNPARLNRANSFIQISAQIAYLAGPAATGVLVATIGIAHLFTIDAATFLLSAGLIMLIRMPKTKPLHLEAGPTALPQMPPATGGNRSEILEGLRHAWKDLRLRGLLFITAVDNLIIMGPAILGTPIYVREILGYGDQGATQYSIITAVFFLGMITSSFFIGLKGRKWPKGKLIVIGMTLDGLTFIPFFFINTFMLACLAMFIHGLTVPLVTVSRTTLIQKIVPDDRRGRIFALVNLAVVGFTALSMVLCGLLSEILGMDQIFLAIGVLGTICGLVGISFRSLWKA